MLPPRCRLRVICCPEWVLEPRFHLPLALFPPGDGRKMNEPTRLGKSFCNASCTWPVSALNISFFCAFCLEDPFAAQRVLAQRVVDWRIAQQGRHQHGGKARD